MMKCVRKAIEEVATTVVKASKELDEEKVGEMVKNLLSAERIFVLGAGFSRLIAETLALRLMSLGLKAFVVGDITTPSLEKGDVLVSISRSGETLGVITLSKRAKDLGGKVIAVTSSPESSLSKLAHLTVEVKDRIEGQKYPVLSILGDEVHSEMYGTIFFVTSFTLLQGVCLEIAVRTNQTPTLIDGRHTNLE